MKKGVFSTLPGEQFVGGGCISREQSLLSTSVILAPHSPKIRRFCLFRSKSFFFRNKISNGIYCVVIKNVRVVATETQRKLLHGSLSCPDR